MRHAIDLVVGRAGDVALQGRLPGELIHLQQRRRRARRQGAVGVGDHATLRTDEHDRLQVVGLAQRAQTRADGLEVAIVIELDQSSEQGLPVPARVFGVEKIAHGEVGDLGDARSGGATDGSQARVQFVFARHAKQRIEKRAAAHDNERRQNQQQHGQIERHGRSERLSVEEASEHIRDPTGLLAWPQCPPNPLARQAQRLLSRSASPCLHPVSVGPVGAVFRLQGLASLARGLRAAPPTRERCVAQQRNAADSAPRPASHFWLRR